MNLQTWIARFEHFSLAGPDDNEGLLACFEKAPMNDSGWQIHYDRAPDYFAFLSAHAERFFVFVGRGETGIEATGTLVIRPAFIAGQRRFVGYFGDLRVIQGRRWALRWRKFYAELLRDAEQIDEFCGCTHFYTVMLAHNQTARNALVATRPKQAITPTYHPIYRYSMINLIAQWRPIAKGPWQVYGALERDREEIKSFLARQYASRDFGYVFDENHDELSFREQMNAKLELGKMLLLRDRAGKLRACTALWSPRSMKRIVLERLPPALRYSFALLSLARPWPRQGEELRCLYATFFQVDDSLAPAQRQCAARHLFSIALKRARSLDFHVLSVAQFAVSSWEPALRPFICSRTELEMYAVDPRGTRVAELSRDRDPGFEIGFV
jgi:hypothetical protein